MFARLGEFFQNPDGSLSSRRLFGAALIVAALVGWYLGKSDVICTAIIGFGATLLGLTTSDKQAPPQ